MLIDWLGTRAVISRTGFTQATGSSRHILADRDLAVDSLR